MPTHAAAVAGFLRHLPPLGVYDAPMREAIANLLSGPHDQARAVRRSV
jgi:hypothetical protein